MMTAMPCRSGGNGGNINGGAMVRCRRQDREGSKSKGAPVQKRSWRGHVVVPVKALEVPVSAGGTPEYAERLASKQITRLLTWASAKIVLAEFDGIGNEGDLALAPTATRIEQWPDYGSLVYLMEEVPLTDPDAWMNKAMELSPSLAVRLLEVRKRCAAEFDFNLLSELLQEEVVRANRQLMQEYVKNTSGKSLQQNGDD